LSGLGAWLPVVPMPVLFGHWPVGEHDAAAGTGTGNDVGKRVPRQLDLAEVAAMKRQQTIGLDERWRSCAPHVVHWKGTIVKCMHLNQLDWLWVHRVLQVPIHPY
jgi:hypothetical protein